MQAKPLPCESCCALAASSRPRSSLCATASEPCSCTGETGAADSGHCEGASPDKGCSQLLQDLHNPVLCPGVPADVLGQLAHCKALERPAVSWWRRGSRWTPCTLARARPHACSRWPISGLLHAVRHRSCQLVMTACSKAAVTLPLLCELVAKGEQVDSLYAG